MMSSRYTTVVSKKTSLEMSIILRMRICVLFVNSCMFPSRKMPVSKRMAVNKKPESLPITVTSHNTRTRIPEVYFNPSDESTLIRSLADGVTYCYT